MGAFPFVAICQPRHLSSLAELPHSRIGLSDKTATTKTIGNKGIAGASGAYFAQYFQTGFCGKRGFGTLFPLTTRARVPPKLWFTRFAVQLFDQTLKRVHAGNVRTVGRNE
jgi:hypothetical protein